MATQSEAPDDLLFGLLALEHGWVETSQLVAAWRDLAGGGHSMRQALLDSGAIGAEARSRLEILVAQHLMLPAGEPAKAPAPILADDPTREAAAGIADVEVTAHVAPCPPPPPRDVPPVDGSEPADPGDGRRFRRLRMHARGGLGAVYVAYDGELNREVALKQILDHHADDPARRARFLLEAEITGGLEHPGIVPVYGLGRYEDGRPYYAMRFVRGDSLREAIDAFHADPALRADPGRRSLALRGLLRRFGDVCDAIDYAHGRGVIHRDLKPANIIVGKYGETLVVDWGLAKSLGQRDPGHPGGELTLLPSASLGDSETLPGAAMGTPAYMSPEQALGDLAAIGPRSDIYSLGATLYTLLTGRAPQEGRDLGSTLRRICRGEFPPPRQLNPGIHRALEAICLKAMAVEPDARYPTARALADDLERWAADEPVSAWREPIGARAARRLRRHRTLVATASGVLLMAVVGLLGVLAVQARANRALERTNDALARANAREAGANAGLREANAQAQARFELAHEAIRSFQAGVNEEEMLKGENLRPLRDKLLRSAAKFYEKLDGLLQGRADRPSRKILARSNFELGELTRVIGIQPEALAIHRKALAIRRELLGDQPEPDEETSLDVARSLIAVGALAEATGDLRAALADFEEAGNVARAFADRPRAPEDARAVVATTLLRRGRVLFLRGRPGDALNVMRRGISVWSGLAEARPDLAEYQLQWALGLTSLSAMLWHSGEVAAAFDAVAQGTAIYRRLVDDHPDVPQYRFRLATSLYNDGAYHKEIGQLGRAIASYLESLAALDRLVDGQPAVTEYHDLLGLCLFRIALLRAGMGRLTEAEATCRRAGEIQQRLVAANPRVADFRYRLAETRRALGEILASAGRLEPALVEHDRSRAIFGELAEAHPEQPFYRSSLAFALAAIADTLRAQGQVAPARDRYAEAIRLCEGLVAARPDIPTYASTQAACLRRLAALEAAAGDPGEATRLARRAVELFEALPARSVVEWVNLACARATLAAAEPAERDAHHDRAVAALRSAVDAGFRDAPTLEREAALDPLRTRADFRVLALDVAFPVDPFAHEPE